MKDSLKYLLVSGIFFEEMGFTYLGPVDGHNFDELFENLNYAKKTEGPILLHVITKKGKGISQLRTTERVIGMEQAPTKLIQVTLLNLKNTTSCME